MKKRLFPFLALILIGFSTSFSQGLLDDLEEEGDTDVLTTGTFETTRIANGHSVEGPAKNVLLFIVSHRFGTLNSGAYNLFGLDAANIRLGLEYGITDKLSVGMGRSSNPKNFDGFVKYKLLSQQKGSRNIPVTLTLLGDASIDARRWTNSQIDYRFDHRLSYSAQVLIARKFNKRLSLQLSPTFIHKNLVPLESDNHDIIAIGAGGRYKVTPHLAINLEYYYLPTFQNVPYALGFQTYNSFSVGVDLETGGHVFQFVITNSLATFNRAFIEETTENWLDGGIHFGFNISRVFNLKKKKPGEID